LIGKYEKLSSTRYYVWTKGLKS